MDLLLELVLGDVLALLAIQMEESVERAGVEHVVAGLAEHQRQLLVVVGHEGGARLLLGHDDERVDVFHSLVRLLRRHPHPVSSSSQADLARQDAIWN